MEEITLTAKIKLSINKEDKILLDKTLSFYTKACNFVSKHIFETKNLKFYSLNKELYNTLRSKFDLKSQMTQSVIKTVIAKYKTILKNQKKWIKPKFNLPEYDLVWNRDYSLNKNFFSVNTLTKRVKLSFFIQGMEKYFDKTIYKFGTAKLVRKRKKYYLHIPITFNVNEVNINDICNVIGIDRGINFIVTTYDSNHKTGFVNGKYIKHKRALYSKVRKSLQERNTPSSKRRLRKIGQRENRWIQDINHQVSKALVENNPSPTLFVIEDLTNIRQSTERVRLKDRYVSVSWAFYDLEQKLVYKAKQRGSVVLKVDPRYTSQCCPHCGYIEKSNRNKKLHSFKCKNCNYKSNDDRIGAMNLYHLGINYLIDKNVNNALIDTVTLEHISSVKGAVNHPTM